MRGPTARSIVLVGHEVDTTRYTAACFKCGWSGPVHEVSAVESAPNWAAVWDGMEHVRVRHPILRLLGRASVSGQLEYDAAGMRYLGTQ